MSVLPTQIIKWSCGGIHLTEREAKLMKERSGRWKGCHYQAKGFSQEASQVLVVDVDEEYRDANYELKLLPGNKITKQGLLLCGKLKPKQASLPEFCLRWDEKGNHLNVDIVADQVHRDDWKNETNGYKGHRPQKASDYPGRAFRLSIAIPESNIFDGVISLNLARNVEANSTIGLSGNVEAVVVRSKVSS